MEVSGYPHAPVFLTPAPTKHGARAAAALLAASSRVRFPMLSLVVFIGIILPAALWPCERLSL